MEIRFAKKIDLEAIITIEKECFPKAETASPKDFQMRFEAFPECFLVAVEGQKIIGFINGCVTNEPSLPDELYHDCRLHCPTGAFQTVFGLDVLPKYQHQGVARKLLNTFIEMAIQRGKQGVVLTCKDALIPFYETFGFVHQGASMSKHGGASWNDMLLIFENNQKKNYQYRKMNEADLKECAILFQKAFSQSPWNEIWTFEQAYARLEELMSSQVVRGYVIVDCEKVIGMACGRLMTYMSYQELWLDELCLSYEYQGQGLGSQMLDYIKTELKKEGVRRIVLNTIQGFLSERFYKQNDFYKNENIVSMYCDF